MNFNINISKLVDRVSNRKVIYSKTVEFLKALLSPLTDINNLFSDYVEVVRFKTTFNSQRMSLESYLNLKYDSSLERIYIVTLPPIPVEYFYLKEGSQSTHSFNRSASRKLFGFKKSTYLTLNEYNFNFVVYVPQSVIDDNLSQLKADIEYYVFAGKSYRIRRIGDVIVIPDIGVNALSEI